MILNKKVLSLTIVTALIITAVTVAKVKSNSVKPKEVTMEKAIKKDLSETITATGNIEANYRSNIALNNSEKVLKIGVKEGDMVKKGDLLLVMDSSDNENQLEKQQLNLENAQLVLNQMLSTGNIAQKSSSENSLSQAQYALENAQREYDDANKKYGQSQALYDNNAISKDEFEASKKNFDNAAALLKSAQAALISAQNSLNDTKYGLNAKISSQRNQINLIQKDIDNYQKKISDSKVTSNIDGKVIKIDAKENQFPSQGDEILIDDISSYKVVVELKQYDSLKIAVGQKADIKIKDSDIKYSGKVLSIGQFAEETVSSANGNKEYKVKVTVGIDNPNEKIKAGYEAEVKFVVNEKQSAIAIGFDAVKQNKETGEKYIFVVDEKNKAYKKKIKTGLEAEYYIEVIDGIKEGQQYVLNPPEILKDGDSVSKGSSAKTSAALK